MKFRSRIVGLSFLLVFINLSNVCSHHSDREFRMRVECGRPHSWITFSAVHLVQKCDFPNDLEWLEKTHYEDIILQKNTCSYYVRRFVIMVVVSEMSMIFAQFVCSLQITVLFWNIVSLTLLYGTSLSKCGYLWQASESGSRGIFTLKRGCPWADYTKNGAMMPLFDFKWCGFRAVFILYVMRFCISFGKATRKQINV